MERLKHNWKRTAVAVVTEEHLLASIVLVTYFTRELCQENI
jgi:hypothetical protein